VHARSPADAPAGSLGTAVKVAAKPGPKGVEVSVSVGPASVSASYTPAELRKAAASPIVLQDVAR
jgi:hypothetical protein